MHMQTGDLVATISYMVDLSPNSTPYHSWKVALVARRIAKATISQGPVDADQFVDELFYAGLLHEIGCVNPSDYAQEAINKTPGGQEIRYPAQAAAILSSIPELSAVAHWTRCHHERLDGTGYPLGIKGDAVPYEAQLLSLAESVVLTGCFEREQNMLPHLQSIAPLTGRSWSAQLWGAFIETLKDVDYYRSLINNATIGPLMLASLSQSQCPVPSNMAGIKSVLEIAAKLVDNKNAAFSGHSTRVAVDSLTLAKHMGVSEEEQPKYFYAGLIHDFGKIIIPSQILNTPGRLNDVQKQIVKGHVTKALEIWSSVTGSEALKELAFCAFHDHERFEGGGYPDNLKGDQIPLASRIISVVDTYDVLNANDYTYRLVSAKGALSKIRQEAGKQFDPDVVEAFIAVKNNQEPLLAA